MEMTIEQQWKWEMKRRKLQLVRTHNYFLVLVEKHPVYFVHSAERVL